jgi:hypothetical protein
MIRPDVEIHWRPLLGRDEGWGAMQCLYSYLAPRTAEVLYIGKSWGVTVRGRWARSAKEGFWDDLETERGITKHVPLLGEIALFDGMRLSHQLLSDVESLLIREVQPWGNIQSKRSRISRPGLIVCCRGAWPMRRKLFRDEHSL